jgi:hypothetical protein
MFTSIRRYSVSDPEEFTKKVNEGFVPIISGAPGFVAYYGVDEGGGSWSSVSIFKTKEEAEESNNQAAGFVKEHLASMIKGSPQVNTGKLVVNKS